MFGRRETAVMSVVNFIDNCKRDLQFQIKWFLKKDLRHDLSRNKELKDRYTGKRCFILGNGPSLKHHDLSKLSDEYVFTVNNMMMTEDFKVLKSNFHLFFDPNFFDYFFTVNPQNDEERSKMQSIRKLLEYNPEMICFSSYRLKSTFTALFPSIKSHYLFNNKILTSHLTQISKIDRNTPAFQNVVLYAINMAIYMGFDKIYLLGVDMTGFLEFYEYNSANDKGQHFYDKQEQDREKEKKFRDENQFNNEFYLKAFGKIFEHFRIMKNHTSRKKVRLLNASSYGSLDMLERVDYDKLFLDDIN